MILDDKAIHLLWHRGIETLLQPGASIGDDSVFEPPCSIKWMELAYGCRLDAFSYAVSGYFFDVHIGRYTSIGEKVQVGRASHPLHWMSTSPFFYVGGRVFNVGKGFEAAGEYERYSPTFRPDATSTVFKPIRIGNDVYIGHGALIMPGVTVGDGAVIGASAVVTKDVPPYAVVAGNPATVKRMRHPEKIAERLLELAWWRFAPWQLQVLDTSRPEAMISDLECIVETAVPYAPALVSVASIAVEVGKASSGG